MSNPTTEAARRRTFAIISHPDAGKTTLTEHLLLAGRRVVELVGAVGRVGADRSGGDAGLVTVLSHDARRAELEGEMDVVAVRVGGLAGGAVDGEAVGGDVRHHEGFVEPLELDAPVEVGLDGDAVEGHEGIARDELPFVGAQGLHDLHVEHDSRGRAQNAECCRTPARTVEVSRRDEGVRP